MPDMNSTNTLPNISDSELGKQVNTDFHLMRTRLNELVDLAIKKDSSYGSSWKRRGGPGAYLTMVRKFDRLEAQMEKCAYNVFDCSVAAEDGESIDETLKDAINYCALVLITRELIRQKKTFTPGVPIFTQPLGDLDTSVQGRFNLKTEITQNGCRDDLADNFEGQDGLPTSGYVDQDR
jgi:hypothetical protein